MLAWPHSPPPWRSPPRAPLRPTASASPCSAPARSPGSSTSSRTHGLDRKANLEIEPIELASTEAGKIAHQGRLGRPDAVRLAVGRARALARRQARVLSVVQHARRRDGAGEFHDQRASPTSRAGSSRSPAARSTRAGCCCRGWRAAPASTCGGRRRSSTARRRCSPQKALQGEHDATLTFWNFCADLEGKGFKRAIAVDDVMQAARRQGARSRSSATPSTAAGRPGTSRRSIASSTPRARPRRSSPPPRPNGSGSRRASASAIRRRSRSTASATAKASCAARSPRRRPTRARSMRAGRGRRHRAGGPGARARPRHLLPAGGVSVALRLSRSRC